MKPNAIIKLEDGEFAGLYGKVNEIVKMGSSDATASVRVHRGPKQFDIWTAPSAVTVVPKATGICAMGKPLYSAG